MSRLPLTSLPRFVRDRIRFQNDPKPKRELAALLNNLIQSFFSDYSFKLNQEEVTESYADIPEWRTDTVLAKLRSLMEQKAKKDIRLFCSKLDESAKKQANSLLRKSGIYSFRDSIELDLYVGAHTAVSAYFKMAGLAHQATCSLNLSMDLKLSTRELFRTLRFIASLPLRYLMAFDGLFWDSRQYTIPATFSYEASDSGIAFFLPLSELEERLHQVSADEEQTGCPALKARTNLGEAVFDLVESACLDCVQEFYLNYPKNWD